MFAAETGSMEIIELLCSRHDINLDLMDKDDVSFSFIILPCSLPPFNHGTTSHATLPKRRIVCHNICKVTQPEIVGLESSAPVPHCASARTLL